jgi:hypothetical protein
MRDHIQNLDPKILIQTWIPATIQSLGELQKIALEPDGHDAAGAAQALVAKYGNSR